MSTSKHTPGPWKLLAVGDNNRLCPADQSNQSLLTLEDEGTAVFACVYGAADAHLIAAAPELLEALQLCVVRDPSLNANAMVMEAIAKAEGRP